MRDENITTMPDTDLGGGNPLYYKPFTLSIEEMKNSLDLPNLHRYPYTEGDDNIRKVLLDYVKKECFINVDHYSYDDIGVEGLTAWNRDKILCPLL